MKRPTSTFVPQEDRPGNELAFLWLELNRLCNLRCVHCYNDSGPQRDAAGTLDHADFLRVLDDAAALGCRSVQFIGGEPTLEPRLAELIGHARARGFTFVEVYTNATHVPDPLLQCLVQQRADVAVSLYAEDPAVHDAITGRIGSHARTVQNLCRLVGAGLKVRVSIIAMPQNEHHVEATRRFAESLGITDVGVDRARAIGRAVVLLGAEPQGGLQQLCGHCWKGSLCVSHTGDVYPCIMSECLTIGSIKSQPLADLFQSGAVLRARRRAYDEVYAGRAGANASDRSCAPGACCPGGIHSSTERRIESAPACAPDACCPGGIHRATEERLIPDRSCAPGACCPGGIHRSTIGPEAGRPSVPCAAE